MIWHITVKYSTFLISMNITYKYFTENSRIFRESNRRVTLNWDMSKNTIWFYIIYDYKETYYSIENR